MGDIDDWAFVSMITINFLCITNILLEDWLLDQWKDTPEIVLIGAGSTQFGLGTVGDIFKSKILEGATITLHDINPEALKNTKKIADKYKNELNVNVTIEATTNLQDALKNANFCIISIEVGDRFKLWEEDWKIPIEHGSRQIFGENGGPGGLFHTLRIAPEIVKICDEIAEYVLMLVFNY